MSSIQTSLFKSHMSKTGQSTCQPYRNSVPVARRVTNTCHVLESGSYQFKTSAAGVHCWCGEATHIQGDALTMQLVSFFIPLFISNRPKIAVLHTTPQVTKYFRSFVLFLFSYCKDFIFKFKLDFLRKRRKPSATREERLSR